MFYHDFCFNFSLLQGRQGPPGPPGPKVSIYLQLKKIVFILSVLSMYFCITGKHGIEFPRTQRREGADAVSAVKKYMRVKYVYYQ